MTLDLSRHAAEVAPSLLGAILHGPNGSGRVVEVEAYGGYDDEASHAFGGATDRNAPMFGPSGRLYVYLIYGLHHCANVVTGPEGDGQAVLIRAIEPVGDKARMEEARPVSGSFELTNGPGKLCQALGIDRSHSGLALLGDPAAVAVALRPAPTMVEESIVRSTRIGISRAQDREWRWHLDGNRWVSRPH